LKAAKNQLPLSHSPDRRRPPDTFLIRWQAKSALAAAADTRRCRPARRAASRKANVTTQRGGTEIEMGKLENKRALVTGSSSGIGAGVALAFAREGADVVINYPTPKQQEAAEKIAEEVRSAGRKSKAIQADVSEPDQVAQLVEGSVAALGGIDILVNNAGIAATNKVEDMAIEEWDRMMAVHLRSVFLVTRLVLPMMYRQNSGKIVNTASQLAYKASPGLSHYVAAKAAIVAFTRCLALEIGTRNVNANCVAPGATRTALIADIADELMEKIRASIPKGRIGEVDDIVPSYVFLASDEARFYQGQCISPNGGDIFL
jgi:3-oxoacyl-[acyl-carrier protein] reductase